MELKEAIERYGIAVPDNIEEYDKKQFTEFERMYLGSLYNTFYENNQKVDSSNGKSRMTVVLGGQTGAGKSSLIAETKRELEKEQKKLL